ncbi:SGNH/GDSL hydrolase family protein [Micromonospora sonneratiae]|uniref:SGNH/GDSL hydrolase family protein n=1 Tax=Micromonospora sonneratiae TaxID=1184706 RepID=A0ABW3Y9X7_9ACTN
MIFSAGQRIVFVGDSITDCGRRGRATPYGDGYVNLVRAMVTATHPELGLTWVNRGTSGDTVRNLAARWEEDVIAERPDWLVVKIGINDVWRFFLDQPDRGVPIREYESTLRDLLSRAVKATGCRLILVEPYLIEPDRGDPQRAQTDDYVRVVQDLAVEFDAVHVPTQAAFDRVLTSTPAGQWADDRIHPNLPGHAVIAQALLAAIGWRLPT